MAVRILPFFEAEERSTEPLVAFYTTNDIVAQAGYSWNHVIKLSDDDLESCHDFIQWLFPTTTPSKFNRAAPIVSQKVAQELVLKPVFNLRYALAIDKMLSFWGFSYDVAATSDGKAEMKATLFSPQPGRYTRGDHNFLRFTRFIESVRLFGHQNLALSFFQALYDYSKTSEGKKVITKENIHFWALAALLNPEDRMAPAEKKELDWTPTRD